MAFKISFTKLFLLIWLGCIGIFVLNLIFGTSFFTHMVTETAFGKTKIFSGTMIISILVGIISFIICVGSFVLAKILKNKSLRAPALFFMLILLAGPGVYIYSNLTGKNSTFYPSLTSSVSISKENPNQMKTNIFTLVNNERAKAGLKPLVESQVLDTSTTNKANDMFAKNYWAHVSPEGNTPWVLFGNVGYSYNFAGENLAKDYFSGGETVTGWMNSPGHKENILNPNYTETGIAVVDGTLSGASTRLIVQHFGKPYAPNLTASKTGTIIKYKEWCTGNEISVYTNEIIVKKSSDGNTYGMTSGDWICYENFLSGKSAPNRTPSRTGRIISYHEWCTGKDISIYEYELIFRTIDGKSYSMTQGDWDCYDSKTKK